MFLSPCTVLSVGYISKSRISGSPQIYVIKWKQYYLEGHFQDPLAFRSFVLCSMNSVYFTGPRAPQRTAEDSRGRLGNQTPPTQMLQSAPTFLWLKEESGLELMLATLVTLNNKVGVSAAPPAASRKWPDVRGRISGLWLYFLHGWEVGYGLLLGMFPFHNLSCYFHIFCSFILIWIHVCQVVTLKKS